MERNAIVLRDIEKRRDINVSFLFDVHVYAARCFGSAHYPF